jgi:predicted MFS family arabinose efflux permease
MSGATTLFSAIADFKVAFLCMGLLAALALVDAWRLAPDAGAEVSGHLRAGLGT